MNTLRLLGYLAIIVLSACADRAVEQPVARTQGAQQAAASQGGAAQYEQVGPVEDVSFAGARRVTARITIPPGYEREAVHKALEQAAELIAQKENASAVMIFAFRPEDDLSGAYTVGRAIYAPNGRWEDARSPAPKQAVIDMGSVYFSEEDPALPAVGDRVRLKSTLPTRPTTVALYRDSEKWGDDEHTLATVPVGTEGVVLERKARAVTAEVELIQYHVQLTYKGKSLDGWVFDSNVEKQ